MPSSIHDYVFEFKNMRVGACGIRADIIITSFDCKIKMNPSMIIYINASEDICGKFTYNDLYAGPDAYGQFSSHDVERFSEDFFDKLDKLNKLDESNELNKNETVTGKLCGIPFVVNWSVLKFGCIEIVCSDESHRSFVSLLKRMNEILNEFENLIAKKSLQWYTDKVCVKPTQYQYPQFPTYYKRFYNSGYADNAFKKQYIDTLLKYGNL